MSNGTVRPVLVLINAWVMATSQVLKKHTKTRDSVGGFIALPLYALFYQTFIVAALFTAFNFANQKPRETGATSCGEYFKETSLMFGFLKDPALAYHMSVRQLVDTCLGCLLGFAFAFYTLRFSKPASVRDLRKRVVVFAAVQVAVSIVFNISHIAATGGGGGENPCPANVTYENDVAHTMW